jgi:hypothetical protein
LESLERCVSHLQKRAEVVQVQRLLHPLRHQLRNVAASNATAVADEVSFDVAAGISSNCFAPCNCERLFCIVVVCSSTSSTSSTVLMVVVVAIGVAAVNSCVIKKQMRVQASCCYGATDSTAASLTSAAIGWNVLYCGRTTGRNAAVLLQQCAISAATTAHKLTCATQY